MIIWVRARPSRSQPGFAQRGFQAWLVGGCVRDLVLGREPKDYDISTDARPGSVAAIFPRGSTGGRAIRRGAGGRRGSSDVPQRSFVSRTAGIPAEVMFETDPKQDVLRRDFTINALLLDPAVLDFHDFLGFLGFAGRRLRRRPCRPSRPNHPRHRRSRAALRRGSLAHAPRHPLRRAIRFRDRAGHPGRHPEAASADRCAFRRNAFATSWCGF